MIETLVQDIYNLLDNPKDFSEDNIQAFSEALAKRLHFRLSEDRGRPTLRLSNLGTPDCKLWYSVNDPEKAEKLPPQVRMKFLYGDILEEVLLFLAKEAGHRVEGEQDEIVINGVLGHRDAVIDGHVVDVKSASSRSFEKFQRHQLPGDDAFGYIDQLGSYLAGSKADPLVTDKDTASFLVVDKTLGKICLDTHPSSGVDYNQKVADKIEMLAGPKPPRAFTDEPEGKSGNRTLAVQCSYCPFKHECWPGLRTFLYSSGPKYLTYVERLPKVLEVDQEGSVISQLFQTVKENSLNDF